MRAVPWNTKAEVLKYGPSLRGPCVKNEGLVFHGTARAIQLINSLLYGKNENIRTVTDNLPTILKKNIFHEIRPKSFSQGFLLIFKIVRKFTENFPKIIAQEFYQKHFPKFYNFPKFSEKFETILVDVRLQFCLAAEFIGQDGAILPDDQPIKLREGWVAIKGQLQRFHKLISNDRICPSEQGFKVIFEKSLFVFEISAFKVRN